MRSRRRRGSALIEVLVALVLLASAGTALVTLLGQTEQSLRQVTDSEIATRAAANELTRVSLLPKAQLLAQRVTPPSARWRIDIEQTSRTLFDVTVTPVDMDEPLVRTTLYRPDSANANR